MRKKRFIAAILLLLLPPPKISAESGPEAVYPAGDTKAYSLRKQLLIARYFLATKAFDQAQKQVQQLAQNFPDNLQVMLLQANLYDEQEQTEAALTQYQMVLLKSPGHLEAAQRIQAINNTLRPTVQIDNQTAILSAASTKNVLALGGTYHLNATNQLMAIFQTLNLWGPANYQTGQAGGNWYRVWQKTLTTRLHTAISQGNVETGIQLEKTDSIGSTTLTGHLFQLDWETDATINTGATKHLLRLARNTKIQESYLLQVAITYEQHDIPNFNDSHSMLFDLSGQTEFPLAMEAVKGIRLRPSYQFYGRQTLNDNTGSYLYQKTRSHALFLTATKAFVPFSNETATGIQLDSLGNFYTLTIRSRFQIHKNRWQSALICEYNTTIGQSIDTGILQFTIDWRL